ncbi:MAG: ribonuclease R [Candidatus Cloacimonetes bacterium]|nr:ribonuclease R [Candidatus Cloacimonadota bacterium]
MPLNPQQIVEYLRTEAGRPLKTKELARALGVSPGDYAEFRTLLQRMEDEGLLYRVRRQRYAAPTRINLVVGRFRSIRSGAGFVEPDEGGDDIFIPPNAIESAVDGDKVIARIERRRRGERVEGTIIRVLERSRERVVGVFHPAGPADRPELFGFVVPNDKKLSRDVYVAAGSTRDAKPGDIVVVSITDWGSSYRGPAGVVEEVIGPVDAPGNDVLAIIHGHELPIDFPDDVLAEAKAIRDRGIRPEDLEGRTDLRDRLVFTIDPADARDHDDALSILALEDGTLEVGVHIADVSFYVRPGSPIDAEALNRGTSVYLVDRVIPMLPHELSSDLCSLLPDVDRLAMSLLLRIDPDGSVRSHRLVRSVIRSRHKLSYDEAQEVLDGVRTIDPETDLALRRLHTLSLTLRTAREARGSIDFDLPEARVVLEESGEPADIQRVLRLESHRLIEDYMLLANETIARDAARRKLPIPYRIHEPPDTARIEQLREFVGGFGLRLQGRGSPTPKQLQKLIEQVKGRPEEKLLSTVVLRSMRQARYSEENHGHFGLAAPYYTHFTSPIRRYPDLLLHRICASRFLGDDAGVLTAEQIEPIAKLSSERERIAEAAERDSIELKKVQYMERHLGDDFEGTISDVRAFGFFVLLDEVFVDGLVHVGSMADDYYAFHEDAYALIGQNTGRTFRLGDRVRVQVASVDRTARRIDFVVLEREGAPVGESTRRAGSTRGGATRPRSGPRRQGHGAGRKGGGGRRGPGGTGGRPKGGRGRRK